MKVVSINPATGKEIASFSAATGEDVSHAVSFAKQVQEEWSERSHEDRAKLFRNLKSVLRSRSFEIVDLIRRETGRVKPDGEAELYDVIDAIDYYLAQWQTIKADTSVKLNDQSFPGTSVSVSYEPRGVIGLITPWNFPFYVPMILTLTSTIAGNSVVLKPSEHSTMVGFKIQALMTDSGFPENLVQILPGADEVGKLLARSHVDKIFVVGSVETGKYIIANAGTTPVEIELGGNSAALVLADADIDLAAAGIAWAGTYSSGQDCVGIKRVVVQREIAKPLLAKLEEIVSSLRQGIDYGPFITMSARDEVKRRVDAAIADGSRLVCGGVIDAASDGFWLSPSVLIINHLGSELVSSETFGNTIPVLVVDSEDEAVQAANETAYGLSNAVFSRDASRATNIASRLDSGMVFINDPFIAMPGWDHWTGWKDSGYGTIESKLLQCLKKKLVTINKEGTKRPFWYPYPS